MLDGRLSSLLPGLQLRGEHGWGDGLPGGTAGSCGPAVAVLITTVPGKVSMVWTEAFQGLGQAAWRQVLEKARGLARFHTGTQPGRGGVIGTSWRAHKELRHTGERLFSFQLASKGECSPGGSGPPSLCGLPYTDPEGAWKATSAPAREGAKEGRRGWTPWAIGQPPESQGSLASTAGTPEPDSGPSCEGCQAGSPQAECARKAHLAPGDAWSTCRG